MTAKIATTSYQAKQGQMLSTAKELHQKDEYLCVPHCAYYACLQLVQYFWYYIKHKTKADLQNTHAGNHNLLNTEFSSYLISLNTAEARFDYSRFNSKINDLKEFRIKADYTESTIFHNDSERAIAYAEEIIKILNKYIKPQS